MKAKKRINTKYFWTVYSRKHERDILSGEFESEAFYTFTDVNKQPTRQYHKQGKNLAREKAIELLIPEYIDDNTSWRWGRWQHNKPEFQTQIYINGVAQFSLNFRIEYDMET